MADRTLTPADKRRPAWLPKSDHQVIYTMGSPWPVAVVVSLYESNALGERRFVETRTFKVMSEDRA